MAKYVLLYSGGSTPESEEAQAASMQAWMGWFGQLGADVLEIGDPFGGASSTITAGGEVRSGGSLGATGWSAISATSLEDAVSKAKGCPLLSEGGSVDVYETIDMSGAQAS
jgi:hypothetical protein